eukprot:TRINITY_DN20809_c0_g1_i1.p1 TRINITY_DN20809_c0_g1~~TRINITY_DN20809_c0_g1_i1.p1  ORF type:complete len:578 (+),score=72.56 TRINITY_DN20809_c0_g1_i1:40-1734(+)
MSVLRRLFVALTLPALSSPVGAAASTCSVFSTCSSCVQHAALDDHDGISCWWCPLDGGGGRCHDLGAFATSKCFGLFRNRKCIASPTTASTCPMKSPDYCPEAVPQIRISKGMMTRSYNSVRVSLISPSKTLSKVSGFDYSERFRWVWQQLALSSKLVEVPESNVASGKSFDVPFTWMHGSDSMTISLPKQGEGTAGLMIADPCVYKGLATLPSFCEAGTRYRTGERVPEMINAMLADGTIKYWATLGDNWYDPMGDISQTLYAKYSKQVLQALNVVVPGNHDYWSFGPSLWPSPFGEQCGNGFMQFNGMDTMAAKHIPRGSSDAPYNFSVDPNISILYDGDGQKCAASQDNMNFYQQIGNVALIGYTGASYYADLRSFFEEACAAVGAEKTVKVVFLLSHWDDANGSTGGMNDSTTPAAFSKVMKIPGCKEFHEKRMFKWITGHTHCNVLSPYMNEWGAEVAEAGMRIAGFGMKAMEDTCRVEGSGLQCSDCDAQANFGFPIYDTTNGRLRILYFDTSSDDKYAAALSCVQKKGWRGCEGESYVSTWLDTPIVERDTVESVVV